MQGIFYNTSRLAVINMKIAKTIANFLARYSFWYSDSFGWSWNKLLGFYFLISYYDLGPIFILPELHWDLNQESLFSFHKIFLILSFCFFFLKRFSWILFWSVIFYKGRCLYYEFCPTFFSLFALFYKSKFQGLFL